MEIRVLGPVEVWDDDQIQLSPAQTRLLARLVVDIGRVVSVDAIVEALWRDEIPSNPRNSLRFHLSKLRAALDLADIDHGLIVTQAPGYLLRADGVDVDAVEFTKTVERARERIGRDPLSVSTTLREALETWRGGPYADFVYDDFARAEIGRLAELRLQAIELRIEADLETGRANEVIGELESLVQEYPYREQLTYLLMKALYLAGRQVEALHVYKELRRRFVDELGIDPSASLQDLELQILAQDPDLFSAQARRTVGNTPQPVGQIIGRDDEIAELEDLLRTRRVVTLTGIGGAGKTRLAIQVAQHLQDRYNGGTWFVDLASVPSGSDLDHALAVSFSLQLPPGADPTEELARWIGQSNVLIVFDNCEHVGLQVRRAVDELTSIAPGVTVLATSRTPIQARGEMLFAVDPLPFPDISDSQDEILDSASVRLLMARAQDFAVGLTSNSETLQAAARLCRLLDGLPLAIEIAAGRLRAVSVVQLVDRLSDRLGMRSRAAEEGSRHGSLQAALEWSHELLTDDQKRLFSALSVFQSPFGLEAVEQVCGFLVDGSVIELLLDLVDSSLVVAEGTQGISRFRLLDTVCEFASEHLDTATRESIRAAHAGYYTDVAHRLAREWFTAAQSKGVARLGEEIGNVRSAIEWLTQSGDLGGAADAAASASQYWFYSGLHDQAIEAMRSVVAAAGDDPPASIAGAVGRLVPLLAWNGELASARVVAGMHRRLAERSDDSRQISQIWANDATLAWCEGDMDRTRAALEARVRSLEELDSPQVAIVAGSYAFVLAWMGRLCSAAAARERLVALVNRHDPVEGRPLVHDVDAWIAFQGGELDSARNHWEASCTAYEALQLRPNVLDVRQMLAWVSLLEGDPDRCVEALLADHDKVKSLAMKPFEVRGLALLGLGFLDMDQLDRAHASARAAAELAIRTGNRAGLALGALAAGLTAVQQGDWTRAGQLLESSIYLTDACSAPFAVPVQNRLDDAAASLADRLPNREAFDGSKVETIIARAIGPDSTSATGAP